MTKTKPYSFMTPMMMFNINMLEASRINNVKRFLYTSSIGVYSPKDIMREKMSGKLFHQTTIGIQAGQKNWRTSGRRI